MADLETLEGFDSHAGLRNALRYISDEKEEWAGIPMPLGEDLPLVIEPRYPRAAVLMAIDRKPEEEKDAQEEAKSLRNAFWSTRYRCTVVIWNEGQRIEWGVQRGIHNLDQQLLTLGASFAWGIEQEAAAVQLLATLVRHHQFKQYMLTGMFMEKSARSGITYLLRRLRPTVAISSRDRHGEPEKQLRILCTLCMHPIGYYQGSWGGAMAPTDDVIAALMLARANEPLLWRRANQIPPHRPEAGL